MVEELVRSGGVSVRVCFQHPNGVTDSEYNNIIKTNPRAKGWNWSHRTRDAAVYVRGKVRHKDHKTVVLRGWHKVEMNTENEARAMRNVAFLD